MFQNNFLRLKIKKMVYLSICLKHEKEWQHCHALYNKSADKDGPFEQNMVE